MRSKLGTKSRLAAHILALILLIFMLVYTAPESKAPDEPQLRRRTPSISLYPGKPAADTAKSGVGTLDRVETPVVATRIAPEALRPPAATAGEGTSRPAPPAPGIAAGTPAPATTIDSATPLQPHAEPLRPPEVAAEETPEEPAVPPVADAPVDATAGDPATEDAAAEDAPVQPVPPQPDESGALVVAASETGATTPVAAATPLPNANLEVLGDGVYWLDSGHDVERELAAVPELRRLVLLAPLPGYRAHGFDHVKTEVIPADPADLTRDAADRFMYFTGAADKPVVIAVLPGARGAAFFKGAYLLFSRSLSAADVIREIAPDLDDAGEARDDIIHRLVRLKD